MNYEDRKKLRAEHQTLRDLAAFALECQCDEAKRLDHDKSATKLLFNVQCDLFREAADIFNRMPRYDTTERPGCGTLRIPASDSDQLTS